MKSAVSKKCQTPTPTTEHASVVSGVWHYANGFATGQERPTPHQWRDAARRRRLGSGSADFRPFEEAWQHHLAGGRSDPVGGGLGVVQRCHPDWLFCRGASLVARRARPRGREYLSGLDEGAGHLDRFLAALVVGAPASVDGRTGRQALARRALAGLGGRWLARQHAAYPRQREGVLRPQLWQRPDGTPQEERQTQASRRQTATGQAAGLGHAAVAHGLANALELENRPLVRRRARSLPGDGAHAAIPQEYAVLRPASPATISGKPCTTLATRFSCASAAT